MQISLPVHTVNCYQVVYIDRIACYLDLDKTNSIDYTKNFLDWNFHDNKIMENVT